MVQAKLDYVSCQSCSYLSQPHPILHFAPVLPTSCFFPSLVSACSNVRATKFMSHRTSPIFDDRTLRSRLTRRVVQSVPKAEHATDALFDALDQGRFDQVRRAISANHACLAANPPQYALTPVDYALYKAQEWISLLEHCRRTGVAAPFTADLPLRERVLAMNLIIPFLLAHHSIAQPTRNPLHIALSCHFAELADTLISRYPSLARSTDARNKTPLHLVCTLSGRITADMQMRLAQRLVRAGGDVNARDIDGRTPLHDLVLSLSGSNPPYGLLHRSQIRPSMDFLVPMIDELLADGADIYALDSSGDSPMDVALSSGQDYLLISNRANVMRENLCENDMARSGCLSHGCTTGLWGMLPDEVIARIFSMLSPREVSCGIGATCKGLRRVAVSQDLWKHLETHTCMAAIREGVIRRGLRNPPTT